MKKFLIALIVVLFIVLIFVYFYSKTKTKDSGGLALSPTDNQNVLLPVISENKNSVYRVSVTEKDGEVSGGVEIDGQYKNLLIGELEQYSLISFSDDKKRFFLQCPSNYHITSYRSSSQNEVFFDFENSAAYLLLNPTQENNLNIECTKSF